MSAFSEDSRVKFPTIKHLMEMGYKYISQNGLESKRYSLDKTNIDPDTNILIDYLKAAYFKLNENKTEDDFNKLLGKIQSTLNNEDLGREFYETILLDTDNKIVDLSTPDNFRTRNTFQVATELTCGKKDSDNFRPDITIFVNGLPLAFIEVKKENNKDGVQAEFQRMERRFVVPAFRRYLNITQIMVFSNDMNYEDEGAVPTQGAFYGAIGRKTSKYSAFREEGQDSSFPLKVYKTEVSADIEEAMLRDNNVVQYKNFSEYQTNCSINTPTKSICDSLFSYERLHFFLKYGIAYANYTSGLQKHLMRYPQLFATKAIEQYLDKGNDKGIIWHTQGSGKTALAYYNVKYLTDYYSKQGIIPQFFFIVDRLDLMEQAKMEFTCRGLKVVPVQTKDDFTKIISSPLTTQNQSGALEITVVNIQKFSQDSKALAKNAYNLKVKRIYFIDEAHRNYDPKGSFLKNLLTSDPDAIKIALTGTPIVSKDFNTKDIFGDYIHTYYYNASIADGYTLRLIRENIHSDFKGEMQERLRELKVNERFVNSTTVFAHENYVGPLLKYIIDDLEKFRETQNDRSLGAMIVCNSKEQALKMYEIFLREYADGSEVDHKFEDFKEIIQSVSPDVIDAKNTLPPKGRYRSALILCDSYDKETRTKWIKLFKEGKVDILIVFQMLQTGFDAPRLKKLYLNRMVKEHNLLQTLTRVNRPYKNLKYGYVVDFANIEEEYEKTNQRYQKELDEEVGPNDSDKYNKLFVTLEEAQKQVDDALTVLEKYELNNATIFSKQLNLITDLPTVNSIYKALETMQSIENLLTNQGDDPSDIINIKEISNLIKATKNRLVLLRIQNGSEERESVEEALNAAIDGIEFEFTKTGEEELELKEQYLQTIKYTRAQICRNIDPADPEYKTLYEAFIEEMTKKGVGSLDDFNMHEHVKVMDDILKRIRRKNEEDEIIAIKYHGDKKFVRIEKRLTEKANENATDENNAFKFTKKQEQLTHILLNIKEAVDDSYFDNQAIANAVGYFTKVIKSAVTKSFRAEDIKTDSNIRSYVTDLIEKEYNTTRV